MDLDGDVICRVLAVGAGVQSAVAAAVLDSMGGYVFLVKTGNHMESSPMAHKSILGGNGLLW